MDALRIGAIVLIAVGILALVYGQFSYTKESQGAKLGPIELTIKEKKTVNVPVWIGAACIIAGTATLVVPFLKQ